MESKLRAQVLQSLPKELEDYVISHYAPDCEQVSPTAAIIHELTFHRCIARGRFKVLVICYPHNGRHRHAFHRWVLMVPEEIINMSEYLENQIEQDRIAMEVEDDPIAFIERAEQAYASEQCEQCEQASNRIRMYADEMQSEQDEHRDAMDAMDGVKIDGREIRYPSHRVAIRLKKVHRTFLRM